MGTELILRFASEKFVTYHFHEVFVKRKCVIISIPGGHPGLYVTFHEQHSIGYGFPSLLLATCASVGVSEFWDYWSQLDKIFIM